jgi:5-methylcytosine-specific restriction endonuclease McrA
MSIKEGIRTIKDKIQGKIPAGTKRSSQWPKVRDAYLKEHPLCEVCGGTKRLNVHHKKPFHLFPELELEPRNFLTLCESSSVNDHILYGHLRNFKSYNPDVETDAPTWKQKILNRPKTGGGS